MPVPVKKLCRGCGKEKPIDEFGYSKRKARPTATCKTCWGDIRGRVMHGESTDQMTLYYADLHYMMEKIHETQAEAAADGGSIDRPIASLGDVWLSEMTEDAYRSIIQALIRKAATGDAVAAKLLLEERHRRLGEPSSDSVESAFEQLFKIDPLTANLDSE